ncbi:G-protein coupled receptor GRL101-like [Ostrea edulis]|uniref:G-protein coupled receptor GRL101-like n=1 Tax=Ostrea edulis TaxID=37623 RepID=UPI002094D4BA|nr:G-protein coupled receptor GRL101-like [Ostrea edulis]
MLMYTVFKNASDGESDVKNVSDRGPDVKNALDRNSSSSSCMDVNARLPSCFTEESSRNTSQSCSESSSENSVVCNFFCPSLCNCSEGSDLCFRKAYPDFVPKVTLRGVACNSFHIDQFGNKHILELVILNSSILNLTIVPTTSLTLNKLTLKNSVFREIAIQQTMSNSYIHLILINNCTLKNVITKILDFGFSYQHNSEIPVVFDFVKIFVFKKTVELSGKLRNHINNFVFFNNKVTNLSYCDIDKFTKQLIIHKGLSPTRTLDLSHNAIKVYRHYGATETLYLNNNLLTETPKSFNIKGENPLKVLDMSCNGISALRRGHFLPPSLLYLNVSRNIIEYIDGKVFHEKSNLVVLDLSWNRILRIQSETFASLKNLQELYIQENQIQITDGMFVGLFSLKILQVDHFSACCAKPELVKDALCIAPVSTISSCDSLIAVPVLRVIIWYMALLAFFGNGIVLLYHILGYKRNGSKSYIILTMNLSCADLLMSIYLFIIGIANIILSGKYGVSDHAWRHSVACTVAGIIATLSSEVSAVIVFLIMFDRFIAIKYPFSRLRLKARSASFVSFFAWALSLVLTLLPLSSMPFFEDFYAQSGICISLPLSVIRKPGWEYSMILFVGLNFILFLGIFVGQVFIFLEVTKTRKMVSAPRVKKLETALAVNLFAVVMTDMLCWIPIGTECSHSLDLTCHLKSTTGSQCWFYRSTRH